MIETLLIVLAAGAVVERISAWRERAAIVRFIRSYGGTAAVPDLRAAALEIERGVHREKRA